MFEIKKGLKLPPKSTGRGRSEKYPFKQMEVGDAFDVPDDLGKTNNGNSIARKRIASAFKSFTKRNNLDAKFTTRKLDGIIRCFRIK